MLFRSAPRGYSRSVRYIYPHFRCAEAANTTTRSYTSTRAYAPAVVSIAIALLPIHNAVTIRSVHFRCFIPASSSCICGVYDNGCFPIGNKADHDGEKSCPNQDFCARSSTKISHDMQRPSIRFMLYRSRTRSRSRFSRTGEKGYRFERRFGVG